MKKNNVKKIQSNVSFWKVFWFIIKVSLISFGGGNAVFPIIKNEAVNKHKWITEKQLDEIIIITNALPGASVPEAISYIGITTLGKTKGLLVTFLGLLPHIFIFFGLFVIGIEFIPQHYLSIIYVAVMPIIIAMLITLVIRYIKLSKKELSYPVFLSLFMLTVGFNIFIPSPWNIPAFVILFVIILGTAYELWRRHKIKTYQYIDKPESIKDIDMHNLEYKNLLKKYKNNKNDVYKFLLDIFPTITLEDLDVKYKVRWTKKLGLHLMPGKKYSFNEQVKND